MALSGTRDDSYTVANLLDEVFTHLQVKRGGNPISSVQAANGIAALKGMLRTWSVKGINLHLWQDQTVTPVNGTSSYALTIRALEVAQGWRRTAGNDTPLRMYTREEYNRLPNKTASGSPFVAFVDMDRAATNIVTYPVPDTTSAANDVLYFPCKVALQDALSTAQDFDLPPEWSETVMWNLTKRLIPQYPGLDPQALQIIYEMAQTTYDDLAGHDREGSVFMRPARHG